MNRDCHLELVTVDHLEILKMIFAHKALKLVCFDFIKLACFLMITN